MPKRSGEVRYCARVDCNTVLKSHQLRFCSCECHWIDMKGKRCFSEPNPAKGKESWNHGKSKYHEFLDQNQNKHFCGCGCGNPIKILVYQHGKTGIPKFIKGHNSRVENYARGKTGEKAPNWRGGVTSLNEAIRTVERYAKWVQSCLRRDHYACQTCKRVGGELHIHHKIPLSQLIDKYDILSVEDALYVEELWKTDNGVTLCLDCHKKTDTYLTNKKRRGTLIYPLPELIDRLSITNLKIEHVPEEVEALTREKRAYERAIKRFGWDKAEVDKWISELQSVNAEIWDLEANIRRGSIAEIPLEDVGRTAIQIRKVNGRRVKLKGDIAERTGSGFKDIKINHASEQWSKVG